MLLPHHAWPFTLPLRGEARGGYEAWERMQEVYDTTGNLKEWRQSSWLINASELCLDAS